MYFKAGVYNQNRSGDPEDYLQATFYELENSHAAYDFQGLKHLEAGEPFYPFAGLPKAR